ncbi:MAG: GNAT family N-acetyltransferase [bacterium]|nr:GNAT family N-acetyltransferase [bacterium]
MKKKLKIENLSKEFIPEVVGLYSELADFIKHEAKDDYFNFDSLSENDLEKSLEASLTDSSVVTYVAIEDEHTVGFITGEITNLFFPISEASEIGHINAAYIVPSRRRQGIIKDLEDEVYTFFESRNVKYVDFMSYQRILDIHKKKN